MTLVAPAIAQGANPTSPAPSSPNPSAECGHRGDNGVCNASGPRGGNQGNETRPGGTSACPEGAQCMGGPRGDGGLGGRDGPRNGTERAQAMEERAEARWNALSEKAREKGLKRAEDSHLFGRLAYESGTGIVSGAFVRFHLDAATGTLTDFMVRNATGLVPVFTSVTPSAFTAGDAAAVHGSVLHVDGAPVSFNVHNNPTAQATYRAAGNVTLTLVAQPGVKINVSGPHEAKLTVGGMHLHVLAHSNATLAVTGSTLTVTLVAGESLMLRAHPPGVDGTALHTENYAFLHGLLGALVRVAGTDGNASVEDGEHIDAEGHATHVRHGRVELNVSSEQHEGRIMVFTIDAAALEPSHAARIVARLGDTDMTRVASIDALVAATGWAYYLGPSADNKSVVVAIKVAHFSSYAIALADLDVAGSNVAASGATDAPAGTSGNGAPAGTSAGASGATGTPSPSVAVVAVAVLAAVLLALRRRAA